MNVLLEALGESQAALERSRAKHYLRGFDDSTREIEHAVHGLRAVERSLRVSPPTTGERIQLLVKLQSLKREIRQAEAVHSQAVTLQSGWSDQLARILGIEPAPGYGRDTLPQIVLAASRIVLEA